MSLMEKIKQLLTPPAVKGVEEREREAQRRQEESEHRLRQTQRRQDWLAARIQAQRNEILARGRMDDY